MSPRRFPLSIRNRSAWSQFVTVAVLLGYSSLARDGNAHPMTKIMDNGPTSNRVDVVVLGDGYTAEDIDTVYASHVQAILNHMFFDRQDPFPRYQEFFNVFRIDVISNERGADVPDEAIYQDTALDASYLADGALERLLSIDAVKANHAFSEAMSSDPFFADIRLVPVNSTRYGGSSGDLYTVFAAGNAQAGELVLHELGHSFSGLGDEYGGAQESYVGKEPKKPNLTTSPEGDKWGQWIGYDQPGIGQIGAYEGGGYYDRGIYRPSENSKMRSLGRPFDAVGREQIILTIYEYVDPLDDWSENTDELYNPSSLWVDTIDPSVIDVQWFINGTLVPDAQDESFDLARLVPDGPRSYEITAVAEDTTEWVRVQRDQLRQTTTWNVTLNPADLDDDHQITVADIDLLTVAHLAPQPDLEFDLNLDGRVDQQDRETWVVQLAKTFFGDANLDGRFDSSDMVVVFQAGLYEDSVPQNATWATGDWDGNLEFDTSDMVFAFQGGGYEQDPLERVTSVPEPHSLLLWMTSLLAFRTARPRRAPFGGRKNGEPPRY